MSVGEPSKSELTELINSELDSDFSGRVFVTEAHLRSPHYLLRLLETYVIEPGIRNLTLIPPGKLLKWPFGKIAVRAVFPLDGSFKCRGENYTLCPEVYIREDKYLPVAQKIAEKIGGDLFHLNKDSLVELIWSHERSHPISLPNYGGGDDVSFPVEIATKHSVPFFQGGNIVLFSQDNFKIDY
ncbi:hypothetical protein JXB41_05035 [Candidatus Woesearchaeota archaeon]|nr:hypothetical protein [Candidatus Woesearchaeota archaeon]